MEITLSAKIEGLLFFKGEPLSIVELAKHCDTNENEVRVAIAELKESMKSRGLEIIQKNDEVLLGTNRNLGPFLEKLRKEELNKEMSKASLETLAIILYQDGVSRSEIDYIRGVNSSFILRNLLMRGLIEKDTHPTDQRKLIYKPTFELLSYMGAGNKEDLKDFETIKASLDRSLREAEEVTE